MSELPDSIGRLSNLVKLKLNRNQNLEILPDPIANLISLEILNISGCEKLKILPDQLWKLTRLWKLHAGGAILLEKLPDIITRQMTLLLKKLNLSETALTSLPAGISQLSNLEYLNLSECLHLFSVPELPLNLKCISANGCTSMESLPNLSNLKQLEILDLTYCSGLTKIQGLNGLASIKELLLGGCNSSVLAYILTERFFEVWLISNSYISLGG